MLGCKQIDPLNIGPLGAIGLLSKKKACGDYAPMGGALCPNQLLLAVSTGVKPLCVITPHFVTKLLFYVNTRWAWAGGTCVNYPDFRESSVSCYLLCYYSRLCTFFEEFLIHDSSDS